MKRFAKLLVLFSSSCILFSCNKKKGYVDEEIFIERRINIEYRDAQTDSTLLKFGGRYNPDSVAIKTVGVDTAFEVVWFYNRNQPHEGLAYSYFYLEYAKKADVIFNVTFRDTALIRLSNSETDTLVTSKQNRTDIQIFYNGSLTKTLYAGDSNPPTIVLKR